MIAHGHSSVQVMIHDFTSDAHDSNFWCITTRSPQREISEIRAVKLYSCCTYQVSWRGSERGYFNNILTCQAQIWYFTWVCFFLSSSSLALHAAIRSANWRLLISKSSCTFSTSTCFLRSRVDCTVLRPVSSNLLADYILHEGKIWWALVRILRR